MRQKNNKERASLVKEMSNYLKTNYNCILKLDAVKKLKDLYPVSNFTLRENAFMLAYEN